MSFKQKALKIYAMNELDSEIKQFIHSYIFAGFSVTIKDSIVVVEPNPNSSEEKVLKKHFASYVINSERELEIWGFELYVDFSEEKVNRLIELTKKIKDMSDMLIKKGGYKEQ